MRISIIASVVTLLLLIVVVFVGYVVLPVLWKVIKQKRKEAENRRREEEVFKECNKRVKEVLQFAKSPIFEENSNVRKLIEGIAVTLDEILTAIIGDENKREEAVIFLSAQLIPVHETLKGYVLLSLRGVASSKAKRELVRIELDLPRMSRDLREYYEKLHDSDVRQLETLKEIMEIDKSDFPILEDKP